MFGLDEVTEIVMFSSFFMQLQLVPSTYYYYWRQKSAVISVLLSIRDLKLNSVWILTSCVYSAIPRYYIAPVLKSNFFVPDNIQFQTENAK